MKYLREPILWFVVIGVLLFALENGTETDAIVVDESVRSRIAGLWQTQMGREPEAGELQSLVDNWVREEVFYREALRLGLDQDDTIIRRRLVQKLGFLIQDVSDELVTPEELEAHYNSNLEDYTLPARTSFSQIFFKDTANIESARQALARQEDWRSLGEATMLQQTYVARTQREVTSVLGKDFSSQLNLLVENEWVGPIQSSFGYHLVRLDRLAASEVTPFVFVEKKVMADLQRQKMDSALAEYYDGLLQQYDVNHL